ncbi:DUF192 domain-containing protein [Croceicoccus marinus]|jgi:hypothetical protein|uniref:DUF192 domain-containing protein n=1 Tax=Croceicoccus marinus TaxID=450378 RepID=A0A1Z1F8I7_9SPHN|nr:DUF192 domain-containing protein [Croceicoccus marinus]ARU15054.1 hypothetical protein A9D14_01260 [Croceicoccus marinus]QNE05314.1 DUF192 domain-containing protein [Croceicoccus marinus]
MSLRTGIIALSLALGASACTQAETPASTAVAETAAVHPESGLPIVPLTITSGGRDIDFQVEYTTTPQAEMKGLMFRTELGPNEGMIFPNKIMNPGSPPAPRSFYMKNTVIPLDLIFIAPDSTIESIAANAVPYSLDSIESQGPVIAVLEIAGGRAAELGLKPGDSVVWSEPAG